LTVSGYNGIAWTGVLERIMNLTRCEGRSSMNKLSWAIVMVLIMALAVSAFAGGNEDTRDGRHRQTVSSGRPHRSNNGGGTTTSHSNRNAGHQSSNCRPTTATCPPLSHPAQSPRAGSTMSQVGRQSFRQSSSAATGNYRNHQSQGTANWGGRRQSSVNQSGGNGQEMRHQNNYGAPSSGYGYQPTTSWPSQNYQSFRNNGGQHQNSGRGNYGQGYGSHSRDNRTTATIVVADTYSQPYYYSPPPVYYSAQTQYYSTPTPNYCQQPDYSQTPVCAPSNYCQQQDYTQPSVCSTPTQACYPAQQPCAVAPSVCAQQTSYSCRSEAVASFQMKYGNFVNDFACEPACRPIWIPATGILNGCTVHIVYCQQYRQYGYWDQCGNWCCYQFSWTDCPVVDWVLGQYGYYYPH